MLHHLPLGELIYEYSRHEQPRLRIASGDEVIVESEDAFSGQIRTNDDRRDKRTQPKSNPQTGPIFVEEAEPGDALAVTILEINPLIGQCATRTGEPRMLTEFLGSDCPHGVHICPIKDGLIHWSDELTIPYSPMLGCIGTAPAWGVPTTLPAGNHGGNMDLVEVRPGNVVYLPVYVPGGYLYLGDAHAAMGHGELSANGLEMPASSRIKVDVLKGLTIPGPRIESSLEVMAVATGAPMERAVAEAYSRLILWMEADFGWNRWRAFDLLTHVGQISVGYFPIGTVAAKIKKHYLKGH